MGKKKPEKKHARPSGSGPRPKQRPASADDTVEVRVRRKSPWGPMSDKLKHVAEPWVNRLGPNPTAAGVTVAYTVSSMIWNASRERGSFRRSNELKEVNRILAQVLAGVPLDERRNLVRAIYDRAKTDYPDDPRFIADVEVEDRGGGDFHVNVASMEL